MKTFHFPSARLILAACASALLTACVVAPVPAGGPYGYAVAPAGVYAPVAPPTPYYEVQPAIPYPGAVWVGGYWNWSGNRHVWQPGHYERPRPGYRWAPHHWERSQRGGWALQGGGWVR
jgi:hypothetical protein